MKQHYETLYPYSLWMRSGLFCLILLTCIFNTTAQHYNFKNISTEEGVPSAMVYRIHQDRKGYFWYLTDKGIARFDGKDWKYISSADGYGEVGAFHLAESDDGTLWFVTTNFKLYRYSGHKFQQIFREKEFAWVEFDKDKRMHFLTRSGEVFEAFPEVAKYTFVAKPDPGVADYNVGYSVVTVAHNSFVVCMSTGIFFKSAHQSSFTRLLPAGTDKNHVFPGAFMRRNGHVMLTNYEGAFNFDPATGQLTKAVSVANNKMICFYEDSLTQDLWIGTFHGAYRYRSGIISPENCDVYLEDQGICAITRSESGNYLFATGDAGVFVCNFNVLHINKQEGLENENIAYVKHNNGLMYLFTPNGKIYYGTGNKVAPLHIDIPVIGDFGFTENVIDIHDSALLICSSKYYVLRDKKVSPLNIPLSNNPSLWVDSKDPELSRWIWDEVLGRNPGYNAHKIEMIHHCLAKKQLSMIGHFIQNLGDRMFVMVTNGDRKGLLEIQHSKTGILGFKIYPVGDFVSDVSITSTGRMVVSTLNKGIAFIYGREMKWVGTKEGLASDYCSKMLIRDNMIWLSTNKGMSRIDIDGNDNVVKINNFTSDNFLLNNEVHDFTVHNDSVYVATVKGVSRFYARTVLGMSSAHVYIENVQINNTDTPNSGTIELSYDHNNIDLFYKSPGDGNGEQMLYKYVVEGLEADTVFTRATSLHLGAVLPGRYAVKIWSLNMNGAWNAQPAVYSFLIREPFWKTIWFTSLIIILLAIGLWYSIYLYLKVQKRRAHLNTKLIESELRSLRLHMNPHFVFNSLTSLQAYILTNRTDEAEDFIENFSSLVRSIMSYSIKGEITIADEIVLLKQYISLEQVRFKDQFEYDIVVDASVDRDNTIIPSLLIQPFVENAIKHGLTGLSRKGKLQISFIYVQNQLQCIVQDNGRGYVQKKSRQAKPAGHEHISTGISFTTERIKLLLGSAHKEVVTMNELFIDHVPAGIKVEILVPVLNKIKP